MIVKKIENNMMQVTLTLQEQNFLIHALVQSKSNDEDFVKEFGTDPDLSYNVARAKENAVAADTLLTALCS